jgi:hypothetical protein
MDIFSIKQKEDRDSTKFRQPEFGAETFAGLEWWKAVHEKHEPK